MNTKSLLLAAVLAAVGAVSGSAQVTSQNIVGYIRLSLNPGFNLISNQLKNGDNRVGTIFNFGEANVDVYKWTGTGYTLNSFSDGAWSNPSMTLSPGEGFFIAVEAATTVTLIGEVSLQNSIALNSGFNLIASPLPLAGSLTDTATIGFVAAENDEVYKWNGTGFSLKAFSDGAWSGDGQAPQIAIGEGFFLNSEAGGRTYTRNFSVN